ncbi:Uncharacterised protein [Enterobacter cloacae]|uniref:Uncharacterized protein n=1 Tax=Enterobacter cloacae TaxID=550 RepID=A0A0M7HSU1_ENTCL|nr:Uncharacterised protein [Enterobacter cloacae]STQ07413.1 Uncharacterised protein [Enterobacter cloacae]
MKFTEEDYGIKVCNIVPITFRQQFKFRTNPKIVIREAHYR